MSPFILVPRVELRSPSIGARVWDFPHGALEVELTPSREAQFAGANEHMQREQDGKARQLAAVVVVDTA